MSQKNLPKNFKTRDAELHQNTSINYWDLEKERGFIELIFSLTETGK